MRPEVWAPLAREVAMVTTSGEHQMVRRGDGWFAAEVDLAPGERYAFRLDGGLTLSDRGFALPKAATRLVRFAAAARQVAFQVRQLPFLRGQACLALMEPGELLAQPRLQLRNPLSGIGEPRRQRRGGGAVGLGSGDGRELCAVGHGFGSLGRGSKQ